jgi:hypothetical protein
MAKNYGERCKQFIYYGRQGESIDKKKRRYKSMKDSFSCSYDCGCTVNTLKDTLEYWEKELIERQVNAHFATHTILMLRGLIRDKKA